MLKRIRTCFILTTVNAIMLIVKLYQCREENLVKSIACQIFLAYFVPEIKRWPPQFRAHPFLREPKNEY